MAVTDYVSVSAVYNTQTKDVSVTIKTLSGFSSSIPREFKDPTTGQTGTFTGSVQFLVKVGTTIKILGPYGASDNQTYTATFTGLSSNPGSGSVTIQGQYSFTNPSPAPTKPISEQPDNSSPETQSTNSG